MDEPGASIKYQREGRYFMGCGKRDRPYGRTIGTFSGMQVEGQGPPGIESGKDKKGFYKNASSNRKIGENVKLLLNQMGDGRHREGGNIRCLLCLRL
ncbi:hypothetical protein DUI87_16188 [Hirundo rustica rustica]|uniref:Uncharacterized protein n=1 Tax=Hirundo rustica rustica TaxID=333673 RepID=A0A3M0K0J1_HIRRU|nr:hypothetical protein DUI87_16188 [Hirundo rustica rustica]